MSLIRYLQNLSTGRTILWCYFIWWALSIVNHFDSTPRIWLTSVGLSGIIGAALFVMVLVMLVNWVVGSGVAA